VRGVLAGAIVGFLLAAPAPPGASAGPPQRNGRAETTLTVFAAASLNEVFRKEAEAFHGAHPGTTFAFNFAGSQQLAQQIVLGARADVFASADMRQMHAAAPLIDSTSVRVFARNRLVVVVPSSPDRRVRRLSDLASPGVRLVLAARAVPAGDYAQQFIGKCASGGEFRDDFGSAVARNVVSYEENVRAVLAKVVLAEADAGIVYVSDAASAARNTVDTVDIPERLNVTAEYPVGRTRESAHAAEAERFIRFLLSEAGQQILARAGFTRALPRAAAAPDASSPQDTSPHE